MARTALLVALFVVFAAWPLDAVSTRTARPTPPAATDPPEVRALLSSVDMTVSLIDAYGQCRDEGRDHEACMGMIRATLDHAKRMIRR